MDRWIECLRPRPGARLRLYCFPYSGGGASVFRTWGAELGADIEVAAVQLPGREVRIAEPPIAELAAVLDALAPRIRTDLPYAFFGHSLGAVIAYELARRLDPPPLHLFASARPAPQLPARHAPMHALPQAELLAEMNRRYRAIPDAVLREPELLALVVPTLRADIGLAERHVMEPHEPIDVPITAFGGLRDEMVGREELAAWAARTRRAFALEQLEGDHFYLNDAASRSRLFAAIRRALG